jgi:hypothetical protein
VTTYGVSNNPDDWDDLEADDDPEPRRWWIGKMLSALACHLRKRPEDIGWMAKNREYRAELRRRLHRKMTEDCCDPWVHFRDDPPLSYGDFLQDLAPRGPHGRPLGHWAHETSYFPRRALETLLRADEPLDTAAFPAETVFPVIDGEPCTPELSVPASPDTDDSSFPDTVWANLFPAPDYQHPPLDPGAPCRPNLIPPSTPGPSPPSGSNSGPESAPESRRPSIWGAGPYPWSCQCQRHSRYPEQLDRHTPTYGWYWDFPDIDQRQFLPRLDWHNSRHQPKKRPRRRWWRAHEQRAKVETASLPDIDEYEAWESSVKYPTWTRTAKGKWPAYLSNRSV